MAKKLSEEEKEKRQITREKNKQEKLKKQEEERIQGLLDRSLNDLRNYPPTVPRYTFLKGEKARPKRANWKDLTILEVLDDGTIYLIEYTSTNHNYGNPIETRKKDYVSWLDLIKENEKQSPNNFNERGQHLQISFHNTHLSDLFSKYYRFKTEMSPDYQRGLVWSDEDKINLIDSIFKGIEIGKFAFISLPYAANSPSYEILDGKQRMNTLIEFYEDKFKYKGFYFSQLTLTDRHYFLDYNITVGKTDESITQKQKYEYFLRLNTSGKPQDLSHLKYVKGLLNEK